MKHFTRWLPAIAKTPHRKTALTIAGVAALGGLAVAPTAVAAPVTTGPHAGAVAAIDLATGKKTEIDPDTGQQVQTVEPGQTTGSDKVPANKSNKPSREKLVPHGVQGAQ